MVYKTSSVSERYGTASRTITLPLSSWGAVAECCEINEVDMKTTIIRAIATFHAQTKRIEKEISE